MAPTLEEFYVRTPLLSLDPNSPFAGKSLKADVPACGKEDTRLRRLLVDPYGNTVYFPDPKDVSPRTTFLNIDDSLLRRILFTKGGLSYQITDDKGRPTGVNGSLHLCRSENPLSGARYEVYTAHNKILANGPKNPNLLQPILGVELSSTEIINLVHGLKLDASEYAVSSETDGTFFITGNYNRIMNAIAWLEDDPQAKMLFSDQNKREKIIHSLNEIIFWEKLQKRTIPASVAFGAVGTLVGVLSMYMFRKMNSDQKAALSGDVKVTPEERKSIMDSVTIDLTEEARKGNIDPVLGREKEQARVLTILEANDLSGANIPALFGDKGVGKTAIAEGLALDIVNGKLPKYKGWSVVEIKIPALVEGAGVLGAFEKKMGVIINELKTRKNTIFFMDEIHMIMGLGKTKDSKVDAAQMLKTAMARAGLKLIVGTTQEEYKQHLKPDPAFESRLTPVIVNPVAPEVRSQILKGLRTNFLEKIRKIEQEKGETPTPITVPDDVLEHFGNLMGTNTREIKKALALLIVDLKNRTPGKPLSITLHDVNGIIDEINETRRALGQDEFVGATGFTKPATSQPIAPPSLVDTFLDKIGLDATERSNIAPGELAEAITLRLTAIGAPTDLTQEIMLLDKVMTKRPDLFADKDECVRLLLTDRLEGLRHPTATPKTTAAILEAYAEEKQLKDADKAVLKKAAEAIDKHLEKARKDEKEKREATKR